jgi:hypothetical protein
VSKVQKNLSDHTEFMNAKEEFEVWLKRAQGTVQSCEGVGDEAATKDKLETIRVKFQLNIKIQDDIKFKTNILVGGQ